jgi:hypothetical protein
VRLRSASAVLALALAGCGSAQATLQGPTSAPSGGGSAACAPPGSRTLISDRQASVYQHGKTVYGCLFRGANRYRLGSAGFCTGSDRIGPIALSGAIAAYGIQRCGVDSGTAQAVARRLTDGAVLHIAAATSQVAGAESYQSVGAIVVKADGAVGWVGSAHSIVGHGPAVTEVHRIDRRGRAELDHGPGIAAGSLRLCGSQLSWLHSGRKRSATLS